MTNRMLSSQFLGAFRDFVAKGRLPAPRRNEYLECSGMFSSSTGAADEMPSIRIRTMRKNTRPVYGAATDELSGELRMAMDKRRSVNIDASINAVKARRLPYGSRADAGVRMAAKLAGVPIAMDASVGEVLTILERIARLDSADPPVQWEDWQDQERVAGRNERHGPRSPASNLPEDAEPKPSRADIDRVHEEKGYAAAKALADKYGVLWYASSGATRRKPANDREDNETYIDSIWRRGHGDEEPANRPHRQSYEMHDHAPPEFADRFSDDHKPKGRHGGRRIAGDRFSVLTDQSEPAVQLSNHYRPVTHDTQLAALGLRSEKALMAADGVARSTKPKVPLYDGVTCVTSRPSNETALPRVSGDAASEASFNERYGIKQRK